MWAVTQRTSGEQWECNRLVRLGRLSPVLSEVYPLAEVAEAARLVQRNQHIGKVGVLCLAREEGLGVTDPEKRAAIGAERLNPLRTPARNAPAERANSQERAT